MRPQRRRAGCDRGNSDATTILRTLCPWLFRADPSAANVLEELEEHAQEIAEAAIGGGPKAIERDAAASSATSPRAPPD